MAIKVVLSPKLPAPLVEIARSLLPADFDLQVVDHGVQLFDLALHRVPRNVKRYDWR